MVSAPAWLPSAAVAFSRPVVPRAVHAFRYSNLALQKAAGCPASCDAGQNDVREAANQGFSRTLRLLKPVEYKQVFDGATRVVTRYLTLLARPNNLSHPRLGLAISRKSVRSAVNRNQIKRQVRESFRLNQELLGGIDIVVMARGGIQSWNWQDLRSTLDDKWRELHKRCKNS